MPETGFTPISMDAFVDDYLKSNPGEDRDAITAGLKDALNEAVTLYLRFRGGITLAAPALAAVDLVTLPTREGTQLTIYNSEDITMVRLLRGDHRVAFRIGCWVGSLGFS